MSSMILERCAFIHVPKTGGMFINKVFRELGLKVIETAPERDGHRGWDWASEISDVPSFAFVRHPFAWYPSLYAYHRKTGFMWDEEIKGMSFEVFLQYQLSRPMGPLSEVLDWLIGSPIKVSQIGRQERLRSDLFSILTGFGYPIRLTDLMSVKSENRSDELISLSQRQRDQIYEVDRRVFLQWGYKR